MQRWEAGAGRGRGRGGRGAASGRRGASSSSPRASGASSIKRLGKNPPVARLTVGLRLSSTDDAYGHKNTKG